MSQSTPDNEQTEEAANEESTDSGDSEEESPSNPETPGDTEDSAGGEISDNTTTYSVTANGSSSYSFSGDGAPTGNNPSLTLTRGQTYVFERDGTTHPFEIRTSDTPDAPYAPAQDNGTQRVTLTVPTDAPNTLTYVCTVHPAMTGTINIVD